MGRPGRFKCLRARNMQIQGRKIIFIFIFCCFFLFVNKEMDHTMMNHSEMDHSGMDHGSMDHGSMDHSGSGLGCDMDMMMMQVFHSIFTISFNLLLFN